LRAHPPPNRRCLDVLGRFLFPVSSSRRCCGSWRQVLNCACESRNIHIRVKVGNNIRPTQWVEFFYLNPSEACENLGQTRTLFLLFFLILRRFFKNRICFKVLDCLSLSDIGTLQVNRPNFGEGGKTSYNPEFEVVNNSRLEVKVLSRNIQIC